MVTDSLNWCNCLQMFEKSEVGIMIFELYWVSGIWSCSESRLIKFKEKEALWMEFSNLRVNWVGSSSHSRVMISSLEATLRILFKLANLIPSGKVLSALESLKPSALRERLTRATWEGSIAC